MRLDAKLRFCSDPKTCPKHRPQVLPGKLYLELPAGVAAHRILREIEGQASGVQNPVVRVGHDFADQFLAVTRSPLVFRKLRIDLGLERVHCADVEEFLPARIGAEDISGCEFAPLPQEPIELELNVVGMGGAVAVPTGSGRMRRRPRA